MIDRWSQRLCVATAALQAEEHSHSAEEHHCTAGLRHCGEDDIVAVSARVADGEPLPPVIDIRAFRQSGKCAADCVTRSVIEDDCEEVASDHRCVGTAERKRGICQRHSSGDDKLVGSLEVGKAANLLLWSADPLDPLARLRHVWLEGNEIEDDAR